MPPPNIPSNASPEVQEEIRRQWYAQQQVLLSAQANTQGLRAPGLPGRGLVIPGGPNGRPLPIRPNTAAASGPLPVRLSNGATPSPEQMQQIIKARQMALAAQAGNGNAHMQRLSQARALQHVQQQQAQAQAQLNAAQAQGTNANPNPDFGPFPGQNTGGNPQCMMISSLVRRLTFSSRAASGAEYTDDATTAAKRERGPGNPSNDAATTTPTPSTSRTESPCDAPTAIPE
jgi:hypothetical protein